MNQTTAAGADTSDREIVLTRLLDAPRELVFKVWSEPEHVARWWGPRGFTITTHSMNVTPSGTWRFDMHSAEHGDFPNQIVYLEVVPPERMVYSHGEPGAPEDFRVTVTFDNQDGKTLLTMRSVFPTAAARDHVVKEFGAIEGGKQTLDRLQEHLAAL